MNDTAPVAGKTKELTETEIMAIRFLATQGRDEVIKTIRQALKKRTGRAWSVTGGRGTAWGWITITAPPARREGYGYMTASDQATLTEAMDEPKVGKQGLSIPSQTDYYRVHLCQAIHGHAGPFTAAAQWD